MRLSRLFSLLALSWPALSLVGCTLDTGGAGEDQPGQGGGGGGGKSGAGGGVSVQGGSAGSGAAGSGGSGGSSEGGSGGGGSGGSGAAGQGGSGGASGKGGSGGASGKGGSGGGGMGGSGGAGSGGGGAGGSGGGSGSGGSCPNGFADCDGQVDNGCETNLVTSVAHCGSCESPCMGAPNSVPSCSKGTCALICAEGFADCDGSYDTGCESDAQSDPKNCGTCGKACPTKAHQKATCTSGACGAVCEDGFADCDANPDNGCERPINTLSDCGACGAVCGSKAHQTPSCEAGGCIVSCDVGFADCNANPDDGCEIDTTTDAKNCNGCGNVCPLGTCNNGVCAAVCSGGTADCDGKPATGCETSLLSDAKNCGVCGHDCLGGTCNNGKCAPLLIAIGETMPSQIATDGAQVIWIDRGVPTQGPGYTSYANGAIRAWSKAGGAPTSLVLGIPWVNRFALDATNVYYTANGTLPNLVDSQVTSVPRAGGPTTTIAMQQLLLPYGITVDAGTVYWSERGGAGRVRKYDLATKTASVFRDAQTFPAGVAVAGSSAYWVVQGAQACTAIDCGYPQATLVTGSTSAPGQQAISTALPNALNLVVDQANKVAFVTAGGTPDAYTDGAVWRVALDGSKSSSVVVSRPVDLALDSTYVYWASLGNGPGLADGGIWRQPRDGSAAPEKLISLPGAAGVAVDSEAIYYTEQLGGGIYRLAK